MNVLFQYNFYSYLSIMRHMKSSLEEHPLKIFECKKANKAN